MDYKITLAAGYEYGVNERAGSLTIEIRKFANHAQARRYARKLAQGAQGKIRVSTSGADSHLIYRADWRKTA